MEKSYNKRRRMNPALSAAVLLMAAAVSCMKEYPAADYDKEEEVLLIFDDGSFVPSKSVDPDENRISDLNIFIFNGENMLEKHLYLSGQQLAINDEGDYTCLLSLLKNCRYSVYVCANTGFRIPCSTLKEVMEYRFHMAYPDEYRIGMLMSGAMEHFLYKGEERIKVRLTRCMAKISVRIDRSSLDSGVDFMVKSVKICGCPRRMVVFEDNSVKEQVEIHTAGFIKNAGATDPLNEDISGRISGEVGLYMFENLQGKAKGELYSQDEKVFDPEDPMSWRCSYVEMRASYRSERYATGDDGSIIYRFYLGEGLSDFNVRRNCHYHITVKPTGSGLDSLPWRIDTSELEVAGGKGGSGGGEVFGGTREDQLTAGRAGVGS